MYFSIINGYLKLLFFSYPDEETYFHNLQFKNIELSARNDL